jgi:hypothetical protein
LARSTSYEAPHYERESKGDEMRRNFEGRKEEQNKGKHKERIERREREIKKEENRERGDFGGKRQKETTRKNYSMLGR